MNGVTITVSMNARVILLIIFKLLVGYLARSLMVAGAIFLQVEKPLEQRIGPTPALLLKLIWHMSEMFPIRTTSQDLTYETIAERKPQISDRAFVLHDTFPAKLGLQVIIAAFQC